MEKYVVLGFIIGFSILLLSGLTLFAFVLATGEFIRILLTMVIVSWNVYLLGDAVNEYKIIVARSNDANGN